MKPILFILSLAFIGQSIKAQKTIVGTGSTINAKTGSDNNSTTRGLLIPSMTTAQRMAINPASDGLLVFDTDFNEFYYRDGNTWRKILNSTFWNSTSNGKAIYNTTDSIGIGTSTPDARLEVVGNVKTSARIDAGGVVEAGGLSSTGALYVSKTSLLQGDVTINSGITINNSGITINNSDAALQLKNGGVNKGFFQTAGDNVRIGTNSGNGNGKFIIRNNGTDRIAVDADGKLTTPATGDKNSLIPLCYGLVNEKGELVRGTANVTVSGVVPDPGTLGNYYVIACPGITSNSIIIATPFDKTTCNVSAACGETLAEVHTFFRDHDLDRFFGFSFVIYK